MNPEGAPLPQRLATLPAMMLGVRFPTTDQPAWRATDVVSLGHQLFYELGNDREAMVLVSRLVIVGVSALVALGLFACAFALFGDAGGLIALGLWSLHPVVLAHAHLVTADIVAAACFFAATACAWRLLWRIGPATLGASLLASGLLALAKMSAVLLAPVFVILAIVRVASGEALAVPGLARPIRGRAAQLGVFALLGLAQAAIAVLFLWAAHGFRYETFRGEASADDVLTDGGWESVEGAGWSDAPIAFARRHHLLPEPTLYGFQHVMKFPRGRITRAVGHYSDHGWWWFHPLVVLLKTPISVFAIVVTAILALAQAWRRGERATLDPSGMPHGPPRRAVVADAIALAPWLVFAAVYAAAVAGADIYSGERHLLPMLPAACMLAAAAGGLASLARGRRVLLLLGALLALEGALAMPHPLAWMNPIAAAPERRWNLLVGSSLDWGQALYEARDLVNAEPPGSCFVAAFSPLDLAAEGVAGRVLPSWRDTWRAPDGEPLTGGTYVVGATILASVDGRYPGPWCERYEWLWSRMRAWDEGYRRASPEERATTFGPDGQFSRERLLPSFERLRLARLCAALRHRAPDDCLGGGAMLVYRLGDDEVRAAIEGPPVELLPGEPVVPWGASGMAGLPALPSSSASPATR